MKKGKYVNVRSAKRAGRKMAAIVLALILCVGGVVGGTVAWLTDDTTPVVNTFTTSDINITLAETKTDFKMVPGCTIEKDPIVTVEKGSEACWLFVKIDKSTNYTTYLDPYVMADGWTALTGVDGVYYRTVSTSTEDLPFAVLKDNRVKVLNTVTKADMDAIDGDVATKDAEGNELTDDQIKAAQEAELKLRPTLTFTAYAIQQAGFNDPQKDKAENAKAAWDEISTTADPGTNP